MRGNVRGKMVEFDLDIRNQPCLTGENVSAAQIFRAQGIGAVRQLLHLATEQTTLARGAASNAAIVRESDTRIECRLQQGLLWTHGNALSWRRDLRACELCWFSQRPQHVAATQSAVYAQLVLVGVPCLRAGKPLAAFC